MTTLQERLLAVQTRMAQACTQLGRAPAAVQLLAVSKLHPAQAVREALAQEQSGFGENYVQEALDKIAALADLPSSGT